MFTQTKREADEVAAALALSMPCEALHGDIAQKTRETVLRHFRDGKFNALVATDVAARGLDIPDVDLVVHYDLPQDSETFLHRSGRTGRAGRSGTAIAMFTAREAGQFRRMLRDVKVTTVELVPPPGPKEVMAASARQVMRRLDNVDADVRSFFEPAADAVLASADPRMALASALAAMSGMLEVPQERSLLSQEVGATTLRVMSRPGRITSTTHVFTIVRKLLGPEAANTVGRVRMLTDADGTEEVRETAGGGLGGQITGRRGPGRLPPNHSAAPGHQTRLTHHPLPPPSGRGLRPAHRGGGRADGEAARPRGARV